MLPWTQRLPKTLLLAAVALASTGATGPGQEMLDEYNRLLNILIYVAAALAAFSLAWAGFRAMWDAETPSSVSRAKSAVVGALSGLLLTLLAKGIMVLLLDSTTLLLPTR
jgi:hypothetical protein